MSILVISSLLMLSWCLVLYSLYILLRLATLSVILYTFTDLETALSMYCPCPCAKVCNAAIYQNAQYS